MGKKVSVIIPAHNADKTLGRQLRALACQEQDPPFEVVVVANRCSDRTTNVAETFCDSLDLQVVIADDLASAAYARNQGRNVAQGHYFLFCDADDQVQDGWVREMVRPLAAGKADFVGGLRIGDYSDYPRWLHSYRPPSAEGICLNSADVPYAITASLAVTREAFDSVNGFDETFPGAGGEDRDFCFRLSRAGYRIGEAPNAILIYNTRSTYRSLLKQQRSYALAGFIRSEREGLEFLFTFRSTVRGIIRSIGHHILRKRTLHPIVYLYIVHSNLRVWLDALSFRQTFHRNDINC